MQSYCNKCQRKLTLKDFNPWSNLFNTAGEAITLIILYTLSSLIISALLSLIGVVGWNVMIYTLVFPLGAVIWWFKNSVHGFKQWQQIQELDRK